MSCKRRNRKGCGKQKNRGFSPGMILIAAGVIILSFFVLPHKVLIILAALALIAAGCILA